MHACVPVCVRCILSLVRCACACVHVVCMHSACILGIMPRAPYDGHAADTHYIIGQFPVKEGGGVN